MNRVAKNGPRPGVAAAKRRILELLKASGPSRAAELAMVIGVTDTAVRQHLTELEASGLVEPAGPVHPGLAELSPVSSPASTSGVSPRGRGRPAARWQTTALADGLFPDGHADLAVSLLQAAHGSIGEVGVERLLRARADRQAEAYAKAMPVRASLARRLAILARRRNDEGYMAEVRSETDGSFLLIEHHCPICAAATICQGLCRTELEVFRTVLDSATVEREAHLLAGESRCVYRITPKNLKMRAKPGNARAGNLKRR